MAKRGFFAEIQHQNQIAARQRAQAERARVRAHAAAVRTSEQAHRQAERAQAQASRAAAAEQKQAEREAKRLHEEAQLARVALLNAEIAEIADELETVLEATLGVDDYVNLETFRVNVEHPPFTRHDLETPHPLPEAVPEPPKPEFVEPMAPSGLSGMFGGKKKQAEALEVAKRAYTDEVAAWQRAVDAIPSEMDRRHREWKKIDQQRIVQLETSRAIYERQCEQREAAAATKNAKLDALIHGLAAQNEAAVDEYIGIVLGSSVYPDRLAVEHEFSFDRDLQELSLTVLITDPATLPTDKAFKYVKARDEVTSTPMTKKDVKDRYASVVHQVAVRSIHEVFEADRPGHIKTIALVVATDAVHPGTGLKQRVHLVAAAAERRSFMAYDLANVVPLSTLNHLGASISKNPAELVGIDATPGVRGR